jgi:CheY-like chemotaxis protein
VRLLFQDSGPGISEQNLKKIFDPFFTTKPVGKGTGLGLSLSYGIIQEHGGTISVRSKEGEGATFVIELPISHADGDCSTDAAHAREIAIPVSSRGKRILLVDDEESILTLLQEALRSDGCQLDVARDGETALRQLRAERYDATVCDWKMPGLNGQQVFERLHELDPVAATRIIFITGDIVNESTRQFIEQRGNRYLSKPFSLDDVRSVVGQVLKAA